MVKPSGLHPSTVTENFIKLLTCRICKGILRAPILSTECQHRFCQDCIFTSLQTTSKCRTCRRNITMVIHDPLAEAHVEILYARKPGLVRRETCPVWTGPKILQAVDKEAIAKRARLEQERAQLETQTDLWPQVANPPERAEADLGQQVTDPPARRVVRRLHLSVCAGEPYTTRSGRVSRPPPPRW